jgi:ATP phosphoribosyltransferase regulatory subunit
MDETIERARELALNDQMKEDLDILENYCSRLETLGYTEKVQLDLSMVKDIDYYNGIVFRGYIRSLPGCILEGGQYDKAMDLLGKDAGAIGFAIYLDELTKGKQEPPKYDVDSLLIYGDGDDLATVMKEAKKLMEGDKTVRVDNIEPEGLRYRTKYIITDGAAKEVK